MTSPLFRAEVAQARRDSWLGEAQIVQPLSIRLMTAITILITIAALLYVVFGTYTRRIHAFGMLTPDVGLITVASPVAGRVSVSGVKEGDRVVQGQLLYTLDLDAVSANGPTQQRIIDQLARQKETIEAQSRLRSAMAATEKRSLAEQIDNLQSQSRQLEEQVQLQEKLVPPLKERVDVLAKAVSDGFARSADLQNQNYLYLQASSQLPSSATRVCSSWARSASAGDARHLRRQARPATSPSDRTAAQLEQQRAESEHAGPSRCGRRRRASSPPSRVQAGQGVAAGATLHPCYRARAGSRRTCSWNPQPSASSIRGEAVMLRYAAFPFQRFGSIAAPSRR